MLRNWSSLLTFHFWSSIIGLRWTGKSRYPAIRGPRSFFWKCSESKKRICTYRKRMDIDGLLDNKVNRILWWQQLPIKWLDEYKWVQISSCIHEFSFRMSSDNGVGHYSDFEDAQYYTISLKQRYAPLASPDVAYIVQLHNCIYSETSVRYLQRVKDHQAIDSEKPIILIAHQFCGNALAEFNATVRQLKVIAQLYLQWNIGERSQ